MQVRFCCHHEPFSFVFAPLRIALAQVQGSQFLVHFKGHSPPSDGRIVWCLSRLLVLRLLCVCVRVCVYVCVCVCVRARAQSSVRVY